MVFCKIFIARNKVEMYVFPMTHPTNHNTVQTRTQQAAPDIDGFSQSMFSQNIKQMQFLEKNYEAYNSSANYAFLNNNSKMCVGIVIELLTSSCLEHSSKYFYAKSMLLLKFNIIK